MLLAWGLAVYSSEAVAEPHSLQVDVTGQQWLWTFSYPGTGVETRSLVLPINRPVQFNVTSVDITHGFWPVDLGVQVDANPGVVTVIRATPDKLGSFTVRCSQLVRSLSLLHVRAGLGRDLGAVLALAPGARGLDDNGASSSSREEVTKERASE